MDRVQSYQTLFVTGLSLGPALPKKTINVKYFFSDFFVEAANKRTESVAPIRDVPCRPAFPRPWACGAAPKPGPAVRSWGWRSPRLGRLRPDFTNRSSSRLERSAGRGHPGSLRHVPPGPAWYAAPGCDGPDGSGIG